MDGSVWADSDEGLTRFANGSFTVLTAKEGLPDRRVRLAASNADRFPLVYTHTGFSRWVHDRFVAVKGVADIPWDRVTTMLEDRSRTLWIGVQDHGVIRVRDGHATHLTTREGLADDRVLSLFEDREGRLWVGTLRNGVTRIANGELTSWSTRDCPANNHVKAFYAYCAVTIRFYTHAWY